MKPGGGGKADTDGTVDVEDLSRESARAPLSSGFEYKLGESEELGTGDRYDGEGSAASVVESAEDVSPGSTGARRVSLGDGRGWTNHGELWETTTVFRAS